MREIRNRALVVAWVIALGSHSPAQPGEHTSRPGSTVPAVKAVRIAAAQPKRRSIDWHITDPGEVLRRVDQSLGDLEPLIHRAGAAGCAAVVFPEDTLGLLNWEAAHRDRLQDVLPAAVGRMRDRLGRAAASHRMYLIVCNDAIEADGDLYNTAILLGRDGQEIGRYHKVNLPIQEQDRARGAGFPVFPTPDLGGVGMLICYDLVFPEATRCLALAGADVVFVPTLGGAAVTDDPELDRAAFRTRAVENFVYLVVARRGGGSLIISPQGKVLAEAKGADALAIAEIDPHGGRAGGDSANHQRDMRARLFRERSPAAFGLLVDPRPPVLEKVPETTAPAQAVRIFAGILTVGEEQFRKASDLARAGKTDEAIRVFERLIREYPDSWIDREARRRLSRLRAPDSSPAHGLAAEYPGDHGLGRDPRVLFVEDFEAGDPRAIGARWGNLRAPENMDLSADVSSASPGHRSLHIVAGLPETSKGSARRGFRDGGHLYTHVRGVDRLHARFYVKFPPKTGYLHHSTALIADSTPTPWPKGYAGKKPAGAELFVTHIEPWSDWGKVPPPGAWCFYSYWQEMKPDGRGDYWGNIFEAGPEPIQPGRWYCIEAMVKANTTPEAADGEQALWVDGRLVGHFRGIRWRSSDRLKLNSFWLLYHVSEDTAAHNHDPAPKDRAYEIWFDDVVLATEYIGPIQGKPGSGRTPAVAPEPARERAGIPVVGP